MSVRGFMRRISLSLPLPIAHSTARHPSNSRISKLLQISTIKLLAPSHKLRRYFNSTLKVSAPRATHRASKLRHKRFGMPAIGAGFAVG